MAKGVIVNSEGKRLASLGRISTLLLLVGPAASLAIAPYSNFDPINLIKLVFVASISCAVLFLLIGSGPKWIVSSNKHLVVFSAMFLLWLFLAIFMSESPLSQQIWGVFGRNTGGLTYFVLLVVLFATAINTNLSFYHKLVDALILTSLPMTGYALVQVAGRDPISWSEMAPFATLGNINFSSAFFGLAALCSLVLASDKKNSLWLRVGLSFIALTQMLIVLETGSIQGFMIFLAGICIAVFMWLRVQSRLRVLLVPYILVSLVGLAGVIAALFNLGPLARFVFQNTILFRFDYWYAGWMMTLESPLFGFGLDSYGDWYRELRGEVATLRTGPDRITNTAHNIYLDISASGGFPLLFFYVLLLGLALRSAVKVIRRLDYFNPYFAALLSSWVAYLIQAGVSINQIGVGIWGWLFTGALIGYEVVTRDQHTRLSTKSTPKSHPGQLPAASALLGVLGFSVGFALAFIPLSADSNFKDSLQTGVVRDQFDAAKALGATAFHLELALDAAIKANDEPLVSDVMNELLQRYPRNFMAWRVKQALASSTPLEREVAYERLKDLDPYNPDIQRVD
jgi:O-antigen ligase